MQSLLSNITILSLSVSLLACGGGSLGTGTMPPPEGTVFMSNGHSPDSIQQESNWLKAHKPHLAISFSKRCKIIEQTPELIRIRPESNEGNYCSPLLKAKVGIFPKRTPYYIDEKGCHVMDKWQPYQSGITELPSGKASFTFWAGPGRDRCWLKVTLPKLQLEKLIRIEN